ncbi:MAG: trehalose-6-phosphate synthase [Acidobacteriota bacterium]|nr:trehalose-6-phosphate synthase [Acidobacteriota bacterium]
MTGRTKASEKQGLIVLSNRLPYDIPREPDGPPPKRNVGGLVSALEPVLAERGGSWIGWDGIALPSAAAVSNVVSKPRTLRTETGFDLYGVPLSEREIGRYYHGFSNRALWPLFHDLLPTAVFLPDDYSAYVRVNHRFAETTLARVGRDDRIWVHDYHLILVPSYLRELGFRERIDFFLHIPFPAPAIFRSLPWREPLLRGFLAADTIAFHTDTYRDNFVSVAESLLGARAIPVGEDEFVLEHRRGHTVVSVAPIGVDVDGFEGIAGTAKVTTRIDKIRAAHGGRKILFSADRLDYTKGIKERFLAVEKLLENHPERAGTFILLQIVVPSRHQVEEYRALKREIDEEVGRINGKFGTEGWAPITYRYRALDRDELVAHYRAASVALVTPLKDGLNLVAPEFVASRIENDGVLILSEFAGVAEHLPGALLVNPYDYEESAGAILAALDMHEEERHARMGALRRHVSANPVSAWADRCLKMKLASETPGLSALAGGPRPLARRPSPQS